MSRRTQLYDARYIRGFRAKLRRRREETNGRWFFAVAGVADDQLLATGVFTGDFATAFFSKQAIKSLKGKLLALRDRHLPGKRMDKITLVPHGETTGVVLSIDSLITDFPEKVPFRKKTLYHACLCIEAPASAPETME